MDAWTNKDDTAEVVSDPRLDRLCDRCRFNFPPDQPWPWILEFAANQDIDGVALQQPSTVAELEESSEVGCHLCTALLEAILPEKAIIGLERGGVAEWRFKIQMLPAVEGWILQIRHFSHGSQEAVEGNLVRDLCLDPVYPSTDDTRQRIWNIRQPTAAEPLAPMTAIQTMASTNINPQAIQQIKKWLHTCTKDHVDCGAHGGRMIFPPHSTFRLVDVGTPTDGNIRIVEVRDAGNLQHEYVTLSYRWTTEIKRTSLKTENKAKFEQSIPTNDWPKVYRDAVSIAHQLEVRYLWIDSLCIIQDQREDWLKQADLMGNIYSSGLLNLAAVEGSGLEVSRNPLRVAPCLLTLQTPGPDSRPIEWLCYRPDDIRKAVDRAPLYKRGWCFQERVLSRRSVHFGDQLFWECTSLRASEAFPLKVPTREEYVDAAIHDIKLDLQTESGPHGDCFHRRWCSVVRCYTPTDLTEPSDRLKALKGIVGAMARRFRLSPTDYLAGLWKPHIAFQLLWARESKSYSAAEETHAGQLANHFPSWSWASCPGEARFIYLHTPLSKSLVRLDEAQASDDAARAVDASFLILRGPLARCEPVEHWLAGRNRYRTNEFCFSISSGGGGVSSAGPMAVVKIELDRPVSDLRRAVYLLPVLVSLGSVTGLVLASTDRKRAGMVAYRRLGYFQCADGTELMEMLVPESRYDNLEVVSDKLSAFILL